MNKKIQILRSKFKKYGIDGYVVPKNDDFFTEYSKINRLKIISNFTGSAGLAIILKNKNYLFTDGRYSIQSKIESGKNFIIVNSEKLINCDLIKGLTLGIDPKIFTYNHLKIYFKNNIIKFINVNLIDQIEKQKIPVSLPFFSIKKEVVGESSESKIERISKDTNFITLNLKIASNRGNNGTKAIKVIADQITTLSNKILALSKNLNNLVK